MFDIGKFKAIIGKHGIAKTSSFAVNLMPPPAIGDSFVNDLPLLVSTASLPGVNMRIEPVRYKGYGLDEPRAVGMDFEPITFTIIGDSSGKVLRFLHKWWSYVFNFDANSDASSYGIPAEMLNYPDEYSGTIELYLYDVTSKLYYTYTLHQAYISNIGGIQVGWEQIDTFMQISITCVYRSYSSTTTAELQTSERRLNTQRGDDARNIEQLQRLLIDPNLTDYQQRLLTV